MNSKEKKVAFFIGTFFTAFLSVTIVLGGVMSASNTATSAALVSRPVHSVQEGDIIYHGIFDEYTKDGDKIADYRALLRSEIISTDDLFIDADDDPDLSILSETVLGKTDVGEISFPNYMDIYTATSVMDLAMLPEKLAYMTLDDELAITLPSASALHFVTSDEYYLVQKALDIMNEQGIKHGALPDYSFETTGLGEYPDFLWPESGDLDFPIVTNETADFHAKVVNMTSASNARHNALNIRGNDSINFACFDYTDHADSVISTSGRLSFYLKFDDYANSNFTLHHGLLGNGLWITVENGALKTYEGSWKYDQGSSSWVAGAEDFVDLGYTISDNNWHRIDIHYRIDPFFSSGDYAYDIYVDRTYDPETDTYSDVFNEKNVPLTFEVSSPSPFVWEWLFFGCNATDGGVADIYVDDITIDNYDLDSDSTTLEPDMLHELLRLASIYHAGILPDNFNYNLIHEFFTIGNQLIDDFSGFTPFEITNTSSELRIAINESTFENMSDALLQSIFAPFNVSLELYESENWTIRYDLCFDKDVDMLNESMVTLNYSDIGLVRKAGLKLVATTTGGMYPSRPHETDYAPIVQDMNKAIADMRVTAVWLSLAMTVTGSIGTILIVYIMLKRR